MVQLVGRAFAEHPPVLDLSIDSIVAEALAGDAEYQSYYRMFPDRSEPDAYERTMVPVFPDEHPGSFTYRNRIRKWVWTSFHNYQWDLNYENPVVFNRMVEEMLFLANQGVATFRLNHALFGWPLSSFLFAIAAFWLILVAGETGSRATAPEMAP
mgnify:CR=1 FL=1